MTDKNSIRQLVRETLERYFDNAPLSNSAVASVDASSTPIDESVKNVITEPDIYSIPAGSSLLIREDAIITPSAQDLIRERQINIQRRARRTNSDRHRLIAIGADHGGYEMKEQLKAFLEELGYRSRDFGTNSSESVDYPDFAHAVARAVADGLCDLGVIIDGAGIGSCMTANKVPGIRAAMCYDEATARNSREHNYANVLTLGSRMISSEQMRRIVQTWLETSEGESRHGKRVAKINAIERQYLKKC